MTVKKTQKSLSATLEKTEQTLGGLENSLGNNEKVNLLATAEDREANDGLPEGWINTNIGDIASVNSGVGFPKKYQGHLEGDYPVYKVGDVSKAFLNAKGKLSIAGNYVSAATALEMKGKIFPVGATAFAKIGEAVRLNRRVLIQRQGLVDNNVMVVKSDQSCMDYYVYQFLRTQSLDDVTQSTTVPSVRKGDIEELKFPLPPLAEQTVIAQTLDTLLAQVDNIKTRLDAIPKILKTFRQSVLAAAVSGKLTEEWRGENECERSFKTLGEAGVNVKTGPFGSALHKADYIEGGVPVINPMHINDGVISPSNSMTVKDEKYEDLKAWHLKSGDVIVGRRGEMGRAAVFKSDDKMLCGTGSMVLRGDENISSEYLCIILRSPTAIAYFVQGSVGSTMVNLNQKIIKALDVYFPPIEEQTQIVRRVEELFAFADQIEMQVKNAQGRVNNLTQSILAKAFRGELTAQWRADNPDLITGDNSAKALLAKIQEEREALKQKTKPKKASKRKLVTKDS